MCPTLFGLYIDGLQCYLMSILLPDVLLSGAIIPYLDPADDVCPMATVLEAKDIDSVCLSAILLGLKWFAELIQDSL